ncbi:3-oxoacyl-ACP synthase [Prodigiosinella aquatilis]|nr:3-oxoacyl-ACP synthase [Prodigiosinella sp. LS101]WJV55462.1 3-oxoacyl-ACP synthase [Prodigiosinella sp. LS101]WJV59823.1 3-oxoacyl-ACP synthase [Pectobacteriaceae bacterium C111]
MRIAAFASDIPEHRLDAMEIIQSAGGKRSEARVFCKLFGIESVAALGAEQSLTDCFLALTDRVAGQLDAEVAIDTLIYVHALPIQPGGEESITVQLCRRHAALHQVQRRYEINQHNCGGGFWGLMLAYRLLQQGIAKRVLLVLGDSLSGFDPIERYIPGCTLLGDGFAALVVDNHHTGVQLDRPYLHHRPEFYPGLFGDVDKNRGFYEAHYAMIDTALSAIGFSVQTHGALLPHNINRLTWMNYERINPALKEKIDLGLLPDVGHCCASDPFLMLDSWLQQPDRQRQPITLLSIGAGAFIGACNVYFPPQSTVSWEEGGRHDVAL